MAALITEATGETVELEGGDRGEFTVWVGEDIVAKKTLMGFPTEDEVVDLVRAALSDDHR